MSKGKIGSRKTDENRGQAYIMRGREYIIMVSLQNTPKEASQTKLDIIMSIIFNSFKIMAIINSY